MVLFCSSGTSMDISLARKCVQHLTISELLCNLYGHHKLYLYSTPNFAKFIGTNLPSSGFWCTMKAQWSLEEALKCGTRCELIVMKIPNIKAEW
jgi:hypothetical protein